jgi:DNA transformation protein and related proteins
LSSATHHACKEVVLDPEFIRELFAPFRHVAVKPMFGGAGLFSDGLMFGLLFDSVIYLKADAATIPDFEREGSVPFTYQARSRPRSLNFWRLPDRLYDDPDELAIWAGRALAVVEKRKRAPKAKRAGPRRVGKGGPRISN